MSADNYYVVRRTPDGRYVALMGFASDHDDPRVDPNCTDYVLFDTPLDALYWAQSQGSEYGASLHPECASAAPKLSKKDQP